MPGMSVNEVEALARHVERQGVKVLRKKDGYLFRLPNQDTCNVHYTSSDVNQVHHIRRALKRSGITMPSTPRLDGEKRGTTKRSRKLVQDALIQLGDPKVVAVAEIRAHLAEPLGTNTLTGALLTMGYAPSGATVARRYHRPEAILGFEQVPATTPTQTTAGNLAEPLHPVDTERERSLPTLASTPSTPPVQENHLVGTWMFNGSGEPGTFTTHDVISLVSNEALLGKLGLRVEIRVWSNGRAK